jgi:signal transduction histidine kinase
VQRFTPKLIGSLDRAIRFCNDIVRFGRAEEAAPRRRLIDIAQMVGEVADELGLPREDMAFRTECTEGLRVDADPDHLHRVLNNLLRNAVQALETAGVRPGEIVVAGWREGAAVVCEIRDNGPGVPVAARPNLFRAFQSTSSKGGTGLGLAISADLVTAHGGQLTLLDSPAGAVFRVEIPDRKS